MSQRPAIHDGVLPEPAEQLRVEQFYYLEAQLLDQRRFREWLELFDADLHYWMPLRRTLPPRQRSMEFTELDELAYFDETFADLAQRVDKIETGKAWAEEPPSRTRHLVTNVQLSRVADGWSARSNFIAYQSRSERDDHTFIGERIDELVADAARPLGLAVRRREIRLDHATIVAPSLSIFF